MAAMPHTLQLMLDRAMQAGSWLLAGVFLVLTLCVIVPALVIRLGVSLSARQ